MNALQIPDLNTNYGPDYGKIATAANAVGQNALLRMQLQQQQGTMDAMQNVNGVEDLPGAAINVMKVNPTAGMGMLGSLATMQKSGVDIQHTQAETMKTNLDNASKAIDFVAANPQSYPQVWQKYSSAGVNLPHPSTFADDAGNMDPAKLTPFLTKAKQSLASYEDQIKAQTPTIHEIQVGGNKQPVSVMPGQGAGGIQPMGPGGPAWQPKQELKETLDPTTGKPTYTWTTPPQPGATGPAGGNAQTGLGVYNPAEANRPFTNEQTLRTQFEKQAEPFVKMRDEYSNIQSLAAKGSPESDQALMFSWIRMFNPRITQTELESTEKARGVPTPLWVLYKKVYSGESLTPAQRQDIVNSAGQVYQSHLSNHESLENEYKQTAQSYNLNPDRAVPNLKIQPNSANYKSVGDVQAAYKAGQLPYDQAKQILKTQFGVD
jgi:hypothetical protein